MNSVDEEGTPRQSHTPNAGPGGDPIMAAEDQTWVHQLMAAVARHAPMGIFWKDRQSNYMWCNWVFARVAGLEFPSCIVGKTDFDMPWRDNALQCRTGDRLVMANKQSNVWSEEQVLTVEGVSRTGRITKVPMLDRQGEVTGVLGFVEDITPPVARAVAPNPAMLESDARYRSLAEASNDFIFVIGRDDRIRYVNTFAARAFGLSSERMVGHPRKEFFPQEVADRQGQALRKVFETGQPHYAETRDRFPHGDVWLSTWLAPIRDEGGQVVEVMGVARDISAQKRLEQERETLIAELRDALGRVNQLSGLLPICPSCKKVRDDKGYWSQIEQYISAHAQVEFSHSLCPECARRLYPGAFSHAASDTGGGAH